MASCLVSKYTTKSQVSNLTIRVESFSAFSSLLSFRAEGAFESGFPAEGKRKEGRKTEGRKETDQRKKKPIVACTSNDSVGYVRSTTVGDNDSFCIICGTEEMISGVVECSLLFLSFIPGWRTNVIFTYEGNLE